MPDYSKATRAKRLIAESKAKADLETMPLAFSVDKFTNHRPRTTAWRQLKRLERMGLVIKIRHGLWQRKI